MTRQKTIAIYDADILSYRASAAIEQRTVEVLHKKSSRTKVFKHRTEFKEYLIAKDLEYIEDDYVITDKQEAEDVSHALQIMKSQIQRINEELNADEHLLFISGKTNFRDSLPLPTKYKSNRSELLRPIHLTESKNYLINVQKAQVVELAEPDDRIIQVGYEYLVKGYKVILVSQDKDAFAYSGLHLYDYTKDNPKVVLIPEIGYLQPDSKGKIRGMGFLWFCLQFLVGDATDGFKPTELCKVKFGEKSAYKLLKDCQTEREALEVCLQKYKEWYPDTVVFTDWTGKEQQMSYVQIMDMYFKCCRMLSTFKDDLDVIKFFDKYDIKLGE